MAGNLATLLPAIKWKVENVSKEGVLYLERFASKVWRVPPRFFFTAYSKILKEKLGYKGAGSAGLKNN